MKIAAATMFFAISLASSFSYAGGAAPESASYFGGRPGTSVEAMTANLSTRLGLRDPRQIAAVRSGYAALSDHQRVILQAKSVSVGGGMGIRR